MALANYTDLKASVADWLADTTLTSQIPDFIAMAEAHLNRDLRHRSMIATATITPSAVNKYVSLPTGWMETISFSDNYGDPLVEVSFEELEDLAYASNSGQPGYYAINNRINFERLGDGSTGYTMNYWKRLDLANDSTNDVMTYHPECYLYASISAAYRYLKNPEKANEFAQLAEMAIKEASNQNTRSLKRLRTDLSTRRFNIIRGR